MEGSIGEAAAELSQLRRTLSRERSSRAGKPPPARTPLPPEPEDPTSPPVFAYGSLLDQQVRVGLLSRRVATVPASVRGWRLVQLPGLTVPGAVPGDQSDVLAGVTMPDLSAAEARMIEMFECSGCDYAKRPVRAATADGDLVAIMYAWVGDLEPREWAPGAAATMAAAAEAWASAGHGSSAERRRAGLAAAWRAWQQCPCRLSRIHSKCLGLALPGEYYCVYAMDRSALADGQYRYGADLLLGWPEVAAGRYAAYEPSAVQEGGQLQPVYEWSGEYELTGRPWFEHGRAGRGWTAPYADPVTGEQLVSYVAPFEPDGVVIAGAFTNLPSQEDGWDLESWRREHLTGYLQLVRQFVSRQLQQDLGPGPLRRLSSTPLRSSEVPESLPIGEDRLMVPLSFGVELEGFVLAEMSLERLKALWQQQTGISATQSETKRVDSFDTWNFEPDSSIKPPAGVRGPVLCFELSSPVLHGSAGLAQLRSAVSAACTLDSRANTSTGLHVHVGFGQCSWVWGSADCPSPQLKALCKLWVTFEKVIDLIQPPSRRADYNMFAMSNRSLLGTDKHALDKVDSCSTMQQLCEWLNPATPANPLLKAVELADSAPRYYKLNLQNLLAQGKPTVEFRSHASSWEATKVVMWTKLLLLVVQRACELALDCDLWTSLWVKSLRCRPQTMLSHFFSLLREEAWCDWAELWGQATTS